MDLTTLSQEEIEFIPCISAVKAVTVATLGIKVLMTDFNVEDYRKMISDLKSQASYLPKETKKLLGTSCYKKLQSL